LETAPRRLTIADGVAEAVIAPEIGAAVAAYHLIAGKRTVPLFRPCRNLAQAQPFDLACNLLIPWSNRISGGGFRFQGRFHPLEPNVVGEPYPIHGNGFLSRWTVESATAVGAELSLSSDGPGPFRYAARVGYELHEGALTMRLAVANLADEPLPFGLGFHPWIVRTADVRLRAPAKTVLLETNDHLPAGAAAVSSRSTWDFAEPRSLPDEWINNCFLGWDGQADVVWLDRRLALKIESDPPLSVYIVYSPSSEADFFCFEPVTHVFDGHNAPGGPEAGGLAILAPRASLSSACRFSPRRID